MVNTVLCITADVFVFFTAFVHFFHLHIYLPGENHGGKDSAFGKVFFIFRVLSEGIFTAG